MHIDLAKEEVLVETGLSSLQVQRLIESIGRRAVLKGMGSSETGEVAVFRKLFMFSVLFQSPPKYAIVFLFWSGQYDNCNGITITFIHIYSITFFL